MVQLVGLLPHSSGVSDSVQSSGCCEEFFMLSAWVTLQKHAGRCTDYGTLPLGVNVCIHVSV